ncbi:MAG: ATP-dependent RNA helicase [Hydrogenophilales bacterium 16-64-46]|nr:MAG: ATP-dependent RNA helicase [Hydrogenophilales bacterium 12-64-13]OYZ06342.1 MAG: ATP-dependent RNA helicase [Hydrogenophilales bacterium 16-64-46]OZA38759.1 MAG: ATP-dependent RNA helicase [Hydrogenophilales bacterium 17-64-34]HQS99619.1 DEAD/DEAH box helicase [Thiobacillus sp.]
MTTFAELGLAPDILRALDDMGYVSPTPIQEQVIPLALQGGDILGAAQTGTGKTAAFALPLIQRLLPFANTSTSPAKHPIRALILTPTRELAIQVEESINAYCKHVPVRSLVVYGGVNINTQIPILKTGIEVLVATPGRLLDHVQNKTLSLNQVNTLVLDEADRMLDMGFMPDLKRIVALLPAQRVNMMFSATFPEEIRKLADSILSSPTFIEVARNTTAVTVTQVVHPVHHERKRQLLSHLIKSRDLSQVLVFTGTKLGCNRLANELNKLGLHADAIHGDKTQQERIKALDAFKAGTLRVLVATDVAARGIDIEALPFVVNYDLPHNAEDYVHRIGRTGRAGAKGEAISLVSESETRYLKDIEKLIGNPIEAVMVPGFEPGAADMPAYDARPPRGERRDRPERGERTERPARSERPERSESAPRSKPAASRDALFDAPYEPGSSQNDAPAPTPVRSGPRKPVAALFRSPPKPAGQ